VVLHRPHHVGRQHLLPLAREELGAAGGRSSPAQSLLGIGRNREGD
jgi:hypothetical protein